MDSNTPPAYQENAFNCPLCGAFAHQVWFTGGRDQGASHSAVPGLELAFCSRCQGFSIWLLGKMVYPTVVLAPGPNSDLPEEIIPDFQEARRIAGMSPRAAAALLRLCVQKLCIHLGESGKDINKDIAQLVSKGLPVTIQQALDIVRVVGNNAVHPGQIDLRDDPETANHLFQLVNLIADVMITKPKHVQAMYDALPEGARQQIGKRDASP